jgi:hypothetical protein
MAIITRFESPEAWLKAAEAKSTYYGEYCENVRRGDPSIVPEANKALERVEVGLNLEPMGTFQPSMFGSRVSVPDFLGGNPMCMRRKKPSEHHCRHVTIYVEVCVMYDMGPVEVRARNTAVLGLLEALKSQRITADIYTTFDWGVGSGCNTTEGQDGDQWVVVRLETRPLDLPNVASMMSYDAFSLSHPTLKYSSGSTSRSFSNCGYGKTKEGREKYDTIVRSKLGMLPTDVYIPEIRPGDLVVVNPVKWIEERISQIKEGGII